MEGKPFQVRTFEFNRELKGVKKTLVVIHGYMASFVCFREWMRYCADHYHVIAFDNCNWGLNTRSTSTSAMESAEKAEQWMTDFMMKTMDALSGCLPEQFFIAAHSYGAYLGALYASIKPERIEAFLMISPMAESYKPKEYNPYKY